MPPSAMSCAGMQAYPPHPGEQQPPHVGMPARDGLCRIPNPPISPTLGKSIQSIWHEHTIGRPPDFPSV